MTELTLSWTVMMVETTRRRMGTPGGWRWRPLRGRGPAAGGAVRAAADADRAAGEGAAGGGGAAAVPVRGVDAGGARQVPREAQQGEDPRGARHHQRARAPEAAPHHRHGERGEDSSHILISSS